LGLSLIQETVTGSFQAGRSIFLVMYGVLMATASWSSRCTRVCVCDGTDGGESGPADITSLGRGRSSGAQLLASLLLAG